jgi:hypothetical protein
MPVLGARLLKIYDEPPHAAKPEPNTIAPSQGGESLFVASGCSPATDAAHLSGAADLTGALAGLGGSILGLGCRVPERDRLSLNKNSPRSAI